MPTTEITSRKTRKGAVNYILNLGYPVGGWVNDDRLVGDRRVQFRIRFTVANPAPKTFIVVREHEDIEEN